MSGEYVYNSSSNLSAPVFPKENVVNVPTGFESKYVAATDWNTVCQNLEDIRYALRQGNWYGMASNNADPVPSGVTNYLWVDTSGNLKYKQGANSNFVATAQLTTKGDLFVYNGTSVVKFAKGTDGQLIRANNATASGLEWSGDYVDRSADQTIGGNKTFSQRIIANGLIGDTGGLVFTENVTDTGDYGTTTPHFTLRIVNPIVTTGIALAIKTKQYFDYNPEGNLFEIDFTSASGIIELNDPAGNYCFSMQTFFQGGSPLLQLNNARKILPDWDGRDDIGISGGIVWTGHHYGIMLGGGAIVGENDDRFWRSVGAVVFDTPTYAQSTSGAVSWQPVRTSEVFHLTSTGNISSITISAPDDGTGRVIDGVMVTLVLKQGNATHTWPATITNLIKPAGVSIKPTTTLNGIDVIVARYCSTAGKYVLVSAQANLV